MEQIIVQIALVYLGVMSLIGFLVMGVDKRKAIRKAWRIPERNLILISFLGGGIGSFLGMLIFRHKTKHLKFKLLLPLTTIIYVYVTVRMLNIII